MRRLLPLYCLLAGCNWLLGVHAFEKNDGGSGNDGGGDDDASVAACADTDCSDPHAVCTQASPLTCECAAGYAGTPCAWVGVVADPGFQDNAQWTRLGSSTVNPTTPQATGMIDPGSAQLPNCATSHVIQNIMMPRLSRAEPLVAEATFGTKATQAGPYDDLGISIGPVRNDWSLQYGQSGAGWATKRMCLGEGQYADRASTGRGQTVQLDLFPTNWCSADPLELDHIEIVPAAAGECPSPGSALNGDNEGTGGWANLNVNASIVDGVGHNGTRGLQLVNATACESASGMNRLSVPMVTSPAFALYHSTTRGGTAVAPTWLFMDIDGTLYNFPPSTSSAPMLERYCMPPVLRGGVHPIRVALSDQSTTCSTSINAEAILDDLAVADEPLCGTDGALADPTFESGLSRMNLHTVAGKSTVQVIADANAHGGGHDLQLTSNDHCGYAWDRELVVVPPSNGTSGPALTFWYKLSPTNAAEFRVIGKTGGPFTMADGAWHQGKVCLNPLTSTVARPVQVDFSLSESFNCSAITPSTAWVDDLAVTTDPACAP